jgi:hypothetical protein
MFKNHINLKKPNPVKPASKAIGLHTAAIRIVHFTRLRKKDDQSPNAILVESSDRAKSCTRDAHVYRRMDPRPKRKATQPEIVAQNVYEMPLAFTIISMR